MSHDFSTVLLLSRSCNSCIHIYKCCYSDLKGYSSAWILDYLINTLAKLVFLYCFTATSIHMNEQNDSTYSNKNIRMSMFTKL